MVPLRAEELLLPGHAEELPDLAVRRADRLSTATSTSSSRTARPTGWRSSAPTWRRTPASPCTSAARPAASTARRTASSTTTAPASRSSRSSPSRSPAPGSGPPRWPRPTSRTLRDLLKALDVSDVQDGAGLDALRRQPLPASAGGGSGAARHPHGDQERQLAALGRAGRALRGRPARGDPRRRRLDHPGDAALARGHRRDDLRAGEVRRGGLPVLPRARPRAGRAVRRARRARCGRPCPSPRPSAASGCRPSGATPTSRCATSSTPGSSSSSRRPSPPVPRRPAPASGGRASSPGAPTTEGQDVPTYAAPLGRHPRARRRARGPRHERPAQRRDGPPGHGGRPRRRGHPDAGRRRPRARAGPGRRRARGCRRRRSSPPTPTSPRRSAAARSRRSARSSAR